MRLTGGREREREREGEGERERERERERVNIWSVTLFNCAVRWMLPPFVFLLSINIAIFRLGLKVR